MVAKRKKPSVISVPNGERYRAMVLEVVDSDGRGPRTFRRVHEDETVNVKDNMAFWIVYANEDVLNEKRN